MNEKITAHPQKEEREKVLKEIRQLENRKKILENKQRNEEGQDKLDSVWSNPDKSGHPLQKKNRSQRPSWNRKNDGENAL